MILRCGSVAPMGWALIMMANERQPRSSAVCHCAQCSQNTFRNVHQAGRRKALKAKGRRIVSDSSAFCLSTFSAIALTCS
jgi:hypothetical protein